MSTLTESTEWQALDSHFKSIEQLTLKEMFANDDKRANKFSLNACDLFVDFSKNRLTDETLKLLINLARATDIPGKIQKMFHGEKINTTEQKAVLHVALRNRSARAFSVDGHDINHDIEQVLNKMNHFARHIRSGTYFGHTGRPIKNIINIGIGGSDLGPAMVCEALKFYSQRNLNVKFISNLDSTNMVESLKGLNPEETLFIVASKTFSTLETMTNAHSAKAWLLDTLKDPEAIAHHFVALSTSTARAKAFGIREDNIFGFWDWVAGRFSLSSAIGLSIMISIGPNNFFGLLDGLHEMDNHLLEAPLEENLPVILGLIGIWYNNFFKAPSQVVLPYAEYLKSFVNYLQQGDMESNGKSVSIDGHIVDYQTGPIVWGGLGNNGQHAFFQLFHQGTKMVPADFIGFCNSLNPLGDHHAKLMANFFAQQKALAFGKQPTSDEVAATPSHLRPFMTFQGNRPSTAIMANKLTPKVLGNLIALYEHKIFIQGAIWNINSFDQWGVEYGKQLAKEILPELSSKKRENRDHSNQHDASTNALINYFLQGQEPPISPVTRTANLKTRETLEH